MWEETITICAQGTIILKELSVTRSKTFIWMLGTPTEI
jgi:hypothetical protein